MHQLYASSESHLFHLLSIRHAEVGGQVIEQRVCFAPERGYLWNAWQRSQLLQPAHLRCALDFQRQNLQLNTAELLGMHWQRCLTHSLTAADVAAPEKYFFQ